MLYLYERSRKYKYLRLLITNNNQVKAIKIKNNIDIIYSLFAYNFISLQSMKLFSLFCKSTHNPKIKNEKTKKLLKQQRTMTLACFTLLMMSWVNKLKFTELYPRLKLLFLTLGIDIKLITPTIVCFINKDILSINNNDLHRSKNRPANNLKADLVKILKTNLSNF